MSNDPNANFGDNVNFTAVVSTASTATPTGTVTFYDGGTFLGSAAVDGNGQATLAENQITGGTHWVTASYGGDGNFSGSDSTGLSLPVGTAGTYLSLMGNSNVNYCDTVNFWAGVGTASGATPTGTVTFYDGG